MNDEPRNPGGKRKEIGVWVGTDRDESRWKGEPDQGMHVIGYDHETGAETVVFGQPAAELPDHDPFGLILLKEVSTFVTRERHEIDVFLVVEDSSFDHGNPFAERENLTQIEAGCCRILLLKQPGQF